MKKDETSAVDPLPAPGAGTPNTLSARLGSSRVGLRSDIAVSRLVFRGEPAYVLRDPIAFGSHRVSPREYRVLTRLRPESTLAEIFEELVLDGVLKERGEEDFFRFIFSLHRLGLLRLPISDEATLYRQHKAARAAKNKRWLNALFFLQVPLLNPDAFLERTARLGRLVFSRWFFALWSVLVATGAGLAIQNAGELVRPIHQIAATSNLPALFATLIGLKVVHEFGHAYACQRFGGRVPEMGVYLIVFAPCAYVDTSSAWSFTRKWQRLAVCLGGMYVELFCAALAICVWSITEPGPLNAAAYNVALMASVVTIAFNANPLMRFDGYYALSDLVEIPNLRARATRTLRSFFKQRLLGIASPGSNKRDGTWVRTFLLGFGVSSAVYKLVLVLGISAAIAQRFPAVGIGLAVVYVSMEVVRILRSTIPYLLWAPETAPVRLRSILVAVAGFVLLPLGLCSVPVPNRVDVPALLTAEHDVVVRAETSGFLARVHAPVWSQVEFEQDLASLEDPEIELDLVRAALALDTSRHRLRMARLADTALALQERERVDLSQRELEQRESELKRLKVRAPGAGLVVEALAEDELGRFVSQGEPLARIVGGAPTIRALLTGVQIADALPQPGQAVLFRPRSDPGRSIPGTILRIEPSGSLHIDASALTLGGGGDIAVDPATQQASVAHFEVTIQLAEDDAKGVPYGMPGRVLFSSVGQPLAQLVLRKFLRFRSRLQHGL